MPVQKKKLSEIKKITQIERLKAESDEESTVSPGKQLGLAINRSWVQFPLGQSYVTTLGKLFTPMCLCHKAV